MTTLGDSEFIPSVERIFSLYLVYLDGDQLVSGLSGLLVVCGCSVIMLSIYVMYGYMKSYGFCNKVGICYQPGKQL